MTKPRQNPDTGMMSDGTAPKRPKRPPDVEFSVIRRIQRALLMLPNAASRKRVTDYVSSRADEQPLLPLALPANNGTRGHA